MPAGPSLLDGTAEAGAEIAGIGSAVRDWRRRRNLTQQALAAQAEVSTRYLSFIETGRARPSREMVSRLAETLSVPLDGRNAMLMAAGYAPRFGERDFDDPELKPVRRALGRLLASHEPYPAFVVDRRWDIRATNRGARRLIAVAGRGAVEPTPNLIRLLLHPAGLGGRVGDAEDRARSLLARVRHRAEQTCDVELRRLYEELHEYGKDRPPEVAPSARDDRPIVEHRFRTLGGAGDLVLFSSVTTIAEARDTTVADLSVEAFFPADDATREALMGRPDGDGQKQSVTRQVNVGA